MITKETVVGFIYTHFDCLRCGEENQVEGVVKYGQVECESCHEQCTIEEVI